MPVGSTYYCRRQQAESLQGITILKNNLYYNYIIPLFMNKKRAPLWGLF